MIDIQELRTNENVRNDFLAALAKANYKRIGWATRNMIGTKATEDLVRNESTQAFLMGANRAIDSFNPEDDGRGQNDLTAWCRFKGLNTVRDFLRVEFGTTTRNTAKREFENNVVMVDDLYVGRRKRTYSNFEFSSQARGDFDSNTMFADSHDYEARLVSALTVHEVLASLSPIDRSIVELLVFGQDDFGVLRTASQYGKPHSHTAADIAHSIGMSHQFVYKRLKEIREVLAPKLREVG